MTEEITPAKLRELIVAWEAAKKRRDSAARDMEYGASHYARWEYIEKKARTEMEEAMGAAEGKEWREGRAGWRVEGGRLLKGKKEWRP